MMMEVPRMRTVNQCMDEILEADPQTGINTYRIRMLAKQGKIPCTKCGTRILINLDKLLEYLAGGDTA